MHGRVTDPFFVLYYPILGAVGVPGNLVTIGILFRGRCGLSRCITWYLLSMALTDLLVLMTAVILNRTTTIYFPASFLSITPVCSVKVALSYAVRDSSVWLTVAFTFNRFVVISCQKLRQKYCTERMAVVVIASVCIVSFVRNIPTYFEFRPLYMDDGVPWYCMIKSSYYTDPFWKMFDTLDQIINPCAPFVLLLLLNLLTVRDILAANRARKRLRVQSHGEHKRDPEMVNRKKSIILLFSISGNFIVLWATHVVNFLSVKISKRSYASGSILQESANALLLLSCCTNTCIYAGTQKKFREEFRNAITYPLRVIKVLRDGTTRFNCKF
ncbi:probable G-protein coupled receptor 139 [Leucoraja erinacea]|uniref:probable G-protein coupled receptor 139 n=1 Tax=Leucoraja erinaceus TaxID=7782 RepID=UPI002456B68D|nr:probable G-protein coupled receptor 139 [Leucoraja erinacea]